MQIPIAEEINDFDEGMIDEFRKRDEEAKQQSSDVKNVQINEPKSSNQAFRNKEEIGLPSNEDSLNNAR